MGIVSDQEWTRLFCSNSIQMRTVGQRWKAPTPNATELLLFSRVIQFVGRWPPPGLAMQGKISSPQYLPVTFLFQPARLIVPMVFLAEQLGLVFLNLFQTKSKGLAPTASTGDLSKPSWSYLTQRVISTTCAAGSRRGCLLPLQVQMMQVLPLCCSNSNQVKIGRYPSENC